MSQTLAEKNSLLRKAVNARLAGQVETDSLHPVTDCRPEKTSAAVSSRHPTSQRFLDLLEEMRLLHQSKSADYGSETDPLANIRQGAEFVNIEPWRGCMVRIADKIQRLRTYCQTGRLVHEGVRDTLLDLSAYSLLAIVLFDEGNVDG
jgi:hypothetical protein